MQEEKKSPFRAVLAFAEEKGFYIILGLCVVAIGVSGYVLFFTGDAPGLVDPISMEEVIPTQQATAPATAPQEVTTPYTAPNTTARPVDLPVVNPAEIQDPPTTEVMNPVSVPEEAFVAPVAGAVTRPFSGQELVYDDTMGDWRVHRGADFAVNAGEDVVSLAAGTVSGVFTDPMLGNCVSVTHEGGLVSTYCGLNPNETVTPGMELRAGDKIGTAAGNVLAESAQSPHIHVETTRDGTYIDPLGVIEG
jgi:murein DD-endopeptidase MepM/ murein hydrolase activator NlpD